MDSSTGFWCFCFIATTFTISTVFSQGCVSDVGFILDSSGSLAREYGKEKKFLIEIAKSFGPGSRAGVVTFSHKAVLSIPMGAQPDSHDFESRVRAIPHMGFTTRIDLALKMAERDLFGYQHGGNRQILILLTDGSQTRGGKEPGEIARRIAAKGIEIVVIGIGNQVNRQELDHMAGASGAHIVSSFDELISQDFIYRITALAQACAPAPQPYVPHVPQPYIPQPTDGNWGAFGHYGACDRQCGGGSQTRYRNCDNPSPSDGGRQCDGPTYESRSCNTHSCRPRIVAVDGHWGAFGHWSSCSSRCGHGTQTRTRSCNNPTPRHGGRYCDGQATETRSCGRGAAPARWSAYGQWSACSSRCGQGTQTRTRSCHNPDPHCSSGCDGPSTETRSCGRASSPARWSAFGHWSACSVRCGTGTQTRTRSCHNPDPSCNSGCVGQDIETRSCGSHAVPARWGAYGPWSSCSVSCGHGTQRRTRTCIQTGDCAGSCHGSSTEYRSCGTSGAPGRWGSFGSWSVCSKRLGCGTQSRTRICMRGPCGGPCVGDGTEQRHCGQPVPGRASWGDSCSNAVTDNVSSAPYGQCVDLKAECSYWAKSGYCNSHAHSAFMQINCCASCPGGLVATARLAKATSGTLKIGARPVRPVQMIHKKSKKS